MIFKPITDPGRPDPSVVREMEGAELPAGWRMLRVDERERFRAELPRELPVGHILKGIPIEALARRNDRDDFLFVLGGTSVRVGAVHLTWHEESDPYFPCTEVFEGIRAWLQYLIDDQFPDEPFDDEV